MLNQNYQFLVAKDIIKTLTLAPFVLNQFSYMKSHNQFSHRFPLDTYNPEMNTLINELKLHFFVSDMNWAWWFLLLLIIPLGVLIYRKRDSISRAYRMAIHKYKKKRK